MGHREAAKRREFTEFFHAKRDLVRRTAYLLCGDWHLADDLAQITFVRLAAAWDRVREPAALDAFTRTCLIRVYLRESRRMWRHRESSAAAPPDPAVGDHADRIDVRLGIVAAMKTLPPRQRATLVCRYYQGLDVAQTAEVLGCSTGTVKSQTARALASLRSLMDVELDVPPMHEVIP
jgi:RNA polymerase sigma-70 factor (sigma-E family)